MTDDPGEYMATPNIRRVAYVDHVTDITIRISEQADGAHAAVATSGRWLTNHIEYGADAEAAAGAMLNWLATKLDYVPEPPADWWRRPA